MNILMNILRWMTCAIIALLAFGAWLSHEYITGVVGQIVALLLTISPSQFTNKLKISYGIIYIILVLIFLLASFLDMKM